MGGSQEHTKKKKSHREDGGNSKHQLGQQNMEGGKGCPHMAKCDMSGKKNNKKKKNHTNPDFYGLTASLLLGSGQHMNGNSGIKKNLLVIIM